MPTGNAKFEAAANAAGCQFLLDAGGGAAQFTAWSLLTGNLWTGLAGAAVTGIAAYAYASNCQWDTDNTATDWDVQLACCPPETEAPDMSGFWRYEFYDAFQERWRGTEIGDSFGKSRRYIRGEIVPPVNQGGDGLWRLTGCEGIPNDQGTISADAFQPGRGLYLKIIPPPGSGCPPPPPQPPADYVYTDPDDGCQINVSFQGWAVEPDGTFGPVWQMDPILPPAKASGGSIIGGCNFSPVIYYGGPGGPPRNPIPVPPFPTPGPGGEPWWLPLLRWAGDSVGNALVDRIVDELINADYPTGSRTIQAACEYQSDGTPEEFTVTFPQENWKNRVLTGLDAITDFQQQILKWKTPTCGGNLPGQTGTPYTINWVSDEKNAHGNSLRKEFRYFDQSGKDLGEHFLHWKDFTWQAGPIFVGTSGTPLGKTHVWAESETEGRRVIEHAATIAGVTLPDDSWGISVARGGRVGQPGTMRLQRSDGRYWISTRQGPSGPPTYPAA